MPERVLAAARQLLASTPATEISVRELAREAGVSHAAPYRHFGDRKGFLIALTTACFSEFVAAQRAACDAAPAGEKLPSVGRAYVAYALAHPHAFAAIFAPEVDPAELGTLVREHSDLLAAALSDAIAAGRLPADTPREDLAMALWSAAHGLAALCTAGRITSERIDAILGALLTH